MYQVTGTKGFANKYPVEGYSLGGEQLKLSGVEPNYENLSAHRFLPSDARKALEEKYMSPVLKKYVEKAHEVGGHGGMDFTMDSRLIYCLQNGLPLDMDVYDLAEWCCLAELGYLSMENNFASVEVPDFTRGNWNKEKGYKHAWASPQEEAESDGLHFLVQGQPESCELFPVQHSQCFQLAPVPAGSQCSPPHHPCLRP
jgi:hypothetical protein